MSDVFFFSLPMMMLPNAMGNVIFLSLYDLWLGKQKTIQSTQNRFVYKNTHSKAFGGKKLDSLEIFVVRLFIIPVKSLYNQ